MAKLVLLGLLDTLVGVAVAGGLIAILIPVLVRRGILTPGDLRGVIVMALILVVCVGVSLFRPGSAFNRWEKS